MNNLFNPFLILTVFMCFGLLFMGFGVRYSQMLWLVPGLNYKQVPRPLASSKYFGNRLLIIGAIGIPFTLFHLFADDIISMGIAALYSLLVVAFLIYMTRIVSELNTTNKMIMERYRKLKRVRDKQKVKPRPVKRI